MAINSGKFVISLDFELMWGVWDKLSVAEYGKDIEGVHTVFPKLLNLFNNYSIKTTFSTVGFLFFKTKDELINNIPNVSPNYKDSNLSPYNGYFENLGADYKIDHLHFAPQLIEMLKEDGKHEIGTHTYCHYYCLEEGQNSESFRADLKKAIEIGKENNINITSIVFPRNQFNSEYETICKENGILCYRGNERSWMYSPASGDGDSKIRRLFRLIDTYINVSGHNCYSDSEMLSKIPIDIPSSRFLRSFNKKLKSLEGVRLKRIKKSMLHAAKNNLTFHLWWHPHNFGQNQDENLMFLKNILEYYHELNKKYKFQSYTMTDLAIKLLDGK